MKNPKLSVVIPLHNEEKILIKELSKIVYFFKKNKINFEILLVENDSNDNTIDICNKFSSKTKNISVIRLDEADYGKALREGFKMASGDLIVNFDIDFYDIDFALQAVALYPFNYDIIIASKNTRLSKDRRQVVRKIISSVFKYILYYLFNLKVSDTHGIKAWRNDKYLRKLIKLTRNNGEVFDTELIVRAQRYGRRLLELPIEVVEKRRSVTWILPRLIVGVWQILNLWIDLNLKKK